MSSLRPVVGYWSSDTYPVGPPETLTVEVAAADQPVNLHLITYTISRRKGGDAAREETPSLAFGTRGDRDVPFVRRSYGL